MVTSPPFRVIDWLVSRLNLLNASLQRDTGGDRDPKGMEKREIIPNTTLPPSENILHYKMARRVPFKKKIFFY